MLADGRSYHVFDKADFREAFWTSPRGAGCPNLVNAEEVAAARGNALRVGSRLQPAGHAIVRFRLKEGLLVGETLGLKWEPLGLEAVGIRVVESQLGVRGLRALRHAVSRVKMAAWMAVKRTGRSIAFAACGRAFMPPPPTTAGRGGRREPQRPRSLWLVNAGCLGSSWQTSAGAPAREPRALAILRKLTQNQGCMGFTSATNLGESIE
jgi:hypothetical protein